MHHFHRLLTRFHLAKEPETAWRRSNQGSGALLILVRRLGACDAALITIGGVIGTGIFLTTGGHGEALPHNG